MHLHKLPVPGYFVIKYRIITAYSNALNSDILRVFLNLFHLKNTNGSQP